MEECRGSVRAPLPPPSSSSYLPASLDDRQPASRSPSCCCAESRRLPPSPGVVFFFVLPVCEDLQGAGERVRSLSLGGNSALSLRALFSSCPSRHMEKMARPLPTFLPPTHGVLKSLLENPLKLPFHHDEGTFLNPQNLRRARTPTPLSPPLCGVSPLGCYHPLDTHGFDR